MNLFNGHSLDLTRISLSVTTDRRPWTAKIIGVGSFLQRSAVSRQWSGCQKVISIVKYVANLRSVC
jgi:hypothetical protein